MERDAGLEPAIRALTRLECVGETMRHALNSVAVVAPDWLKTFSWPDWVERYAKRVDDYRLPKDKAELQDYADQIGVDGRGSLNAIYALDAPTFLTEIPAVETLRRVWLQQYYRNETQIRWRTETEGTPRSARMISSPFDIEARQWSNPGDSLLQPTGCKQPVARITCD